MDRRRFSGGLVLALSAASGGAFAQPLRRVHRIGILVSAGTASDMTGPVPRNASVGALLRGLAELGYVQGRDFVTEVRAGDGLPARFPALAAELARLDVDVLLGPQPTLSALRQATSTIPVVMAGANDPVGEGFVRSLAHPGGNFTGLSNQSADLMGKRLELLKEIAPAAGLVAVLWERTSPAGRLAAETAARERGWQLLALEVRNAGEIERAFAAAAGARAGALLVTGGGSLLGGRARIAELAARNRLPGMYSNRLYVEAGGLMSYAVDQDDVFRRAASYVDKILKGAKPAELPVEQPTKFELVVNAKTARVLGVAVPQSLLLRANAVIE